MEVPPEKPRLSRKDVLTSALKTPILLCHFPELFSQAHSQHRPSGENTAWMQKINIQSLMNSVLFFFRPSSCFSALNSRDVSA